MKIQVSFYNRRHLLVFLVAIKIAFLFECLHEFFLKLEFLNFAFESAFLSPKALKKQSFTPLAIPKSCSWHVYAFFAQNMYFFNFNYSNI